MSSAVAKDPRKELAKVLEAAIPTLNEVAAKHLDVTRMTKVALLAATKTPKLLECDPKTVVQALMQLGGMGLELDGGFGHAYLIPYGKVCTLVIGYQGLIELTLRTEFVVDVRAVVVFEGELFEYEEGTKPYIRHVPSPKVDRRYENIVCAYAVATLKGGEQKALVMWRKEIDLVKTRSKSAKADKSPWQDAYDSVEMARKCPVRKMAKFLPKSRELSTALALDDEDQGHIDREAIFGPGDTTVSTAPQSAKDRLRAKVKPAETVEAKSEDELREDARIAAEDRAREEEARQKKKGEE